MTKKRSLIVALVAFGALMLPLSRLVSFADSLLCMLLAHAGCVNVPPWGVQSKLIMAVYDCFGRAGAQLAMFLLPVVITLIPVAFIYRYVRKRDFETICADCTAHSKAAWTLLVLFVLFSVAWPSIQTSCQGVVSAEEEVTLDEMPASQEPVRLELCLCHPDTEELTKPLMSAGVISTQLVASAKSVGGYRLMTREWKNDDVLSAIGWPIRRIYAANSRFRHGDYGTIRACICMKKRIGLSSRLIMSESAHLWRRFVIIRDGCSLNF